MKIRNLIMCAFLTGIAFITSCKNSNSDGKLNLLNNQQAYLIVCIQEPFNSLTAIQNRSAVPSLPDQSNISYEITAVCGDKTETQNQPIAGDSRSYRLEIEPGEWNITVTGKFSDSDNEILLGQQTIIVDEYGSYNVSIPVYFIEAGKGSVQLAIDVKETLIDRLAINGTNTTLDGEYFKDSNGIINISREDIDAATYSAVLSFYQNIGTDLSPEYALVISLQEKINVRKNTTTDTWKKSGDTLYLIEETTSGGEAAATTFVLTSEIISKLVNSSFYISTTNASLRKLNFSDTMPSDSNAGSWADPLETLQTAVNKIMAVKNNTSEAVSYTVYVDGPVQASGCISLSSENTDDEASITIRPYITPENETTARIVGETESPSFVIGRNCSVCFSDIQLSNINITAENNGKLILDGNTTLTDKTILLKDNTKLYVQNITVNSQNQNNVIARIKSDNPEENKVLIESNDEAELSQGVINRLRLQNPGYYLAYDDAGKKGIIKSSRLSIRLPRIGQCIARIEALSEDNTLISKTGDGYIISREYFVNNNEVIFRAEIETPDFDSENNKILIPQSQIGLKLYIGAVPIPEELVCNEAGAITLRQNTLLPGKYILTAGYVYDGLGYEAKAFIELK
ncbi:MAG: hypothetical protein J5527_04515 [Treponema sp.]|nr:hypothetical protein [Treponema sp.]